ncbi:MAG: AAA family ATPase, partial [Nitrospirae bacterium]|nr:AAA family ATPase [Nitrospirota bacterium]
MLIELEYFNPWWKSGKVPADFLGRKRRIFNEIKAYLDRRQIIIFTGLRRVGKTTLMYQVINELLGSGIPPYNILYFTFDEIRYDLSEIIRTYEAEVLKEDIKNKKIYIFLDEIQKLNDWQSKIKLLYDLNPGIKLFLSGSAQISMWRGTRESLAGRFFDFEIKTLDFDEYLEFKGVEIDRKRDRLFEREIKRHLSDFIMRGGFIEAIELNEHMLRKYIKESL